MNSRTIRSVTFVLPDLDSDELTAVTAPPSGGELIEALISDGTWTGWQANNKDLRRCKFERVALTNAAFTETAINGCTFARVDLSGSRWRDTTIDRTTFTGCRLSGAHLATSRLKNVIFEECRLDYAILDRLQTAGPVAFLGCSFTEATITGSKLPQVILDRCRLTQVELVDSDMRGADLRGNDLTTITGITSLGGARISREQLADLVEPLVRELRLQVG